MTEEKDHGMGSAEQADDQAQNANPIDQLQKPKIDLAPAQKAAELIRAELSKVLIGQDVAANQLLIALLADGHALLEGVPGIAKTLMAKLLSKTISTDFNRIQFTPDLMPSDVIGTSVFNMKNSDFEFRKGPIFSNIVLIDEINRAPAKTQSALFEVMEERQISVEGVTHKMDYPFFIVATQNPIEQEGTYKLPEAQLDRFLFRIKLGYPDIAEEEKILERFVNMEAEDLFDSVKAVLKPKQLNDIRNLIQQVHISSALLSYIAKVVAQTRNTGDLYLGASPRASLAIMHSSKCVAALSGRDFVTPDDIHFVAKPVLNHRIILSPEREMEGTTAEEIIDQLIQSVEIPR